MKPRHQRRWVLDHLIREHRLSYREAAAFLGVSKSTVQRNAREYGITRPCPWRDEDRLRQLYVDEDMTSREAAEELGCTHGTVLSQLAECGIERRDPPTGQAHAREQARAALFS